MKVFFHPVDRECVSRFLTGCPHTTHLCVSVIFQDRYRICSSRLWVLVRLRWLVGVLWLATWVYFFIWFLELSQSLLLVDLSPSENGQVLACALHIAKEQPASWLLHTCYIAVPLWLWCGYGLLALLLYTGVLTTRWGPDKGEYCNLTLWEKP